MNGKQKWKLLSINVPCQASAHCATIAVLRLTFSSPMILQNEYTITTLKISEKAATKYNFQRIDPPANIHGSCNPQWQTKAKLGKPFCLPRWFRLQPIGGLSLLEFPNDVSPMVQLTNFYFYPLLLTLFRFCLWTQRLHWNAPPMEQNTSTYNRPCGRSYHWTYLLPFLGGNKFDIVMVVCQQ